MRKEPNRNVYVGHRYVPLILEEWDNKFEYEGLSVVTHKGASYTSKKRVPVGIDILNKEFWSLIGNYNAQIEYYRQDVERLSDDIEQTKLYIDEELDKNIVIVDGKIQNLTDHVNNVTSETRTYVDNEVSGLTDYVNDVTSETRTYVDEEVKKTGANVDNFGAKGDGVTDDTQAFINANTLFNVITLTQGKTYRIQNFIPRENTTIIGNGSKISRFDNTEYLSTGSTSALVVTNENINIIGGTWTELTDVVNWSGSILIESGSLKIKQAIIEDTWGGIFGHLKQNGSKSASYVSISDCTIRNCTHNTYLADIDHFLFTKNHSYGSRRDGLRTYRNVKNIIVTDNHIYNNGNGTIGQSQDGIDLFIAGYKCIVKNNFLYDNFSKGIDIKHALDGAGETILDNEFIIEGNFIWGHQGSGIEYASNTDTHIKNSTIANNHVYDNNSYGIRLKYADIFNVTNNQVYDNGREGIRIENCISGGTVSGNIVTDNSNNPEASVNFGIYIPSNALNVDVFNNKVTSNGKKQFNGIAYYSTGMCKDNNIKGHSGANISGTASSEIKGSSKSLYIESGVMAVPTLIEKECALTNILMSFGGTGTIKVFVGKRNLQGVTESTIHTKEITVDKAYAPINLDLSDSSLSDRMLKKGQVLMIDITTVSGSYSRCSLTYEFID